MNRFKHVRSVHEVLDTVVDEWCERERSERAAKGVTVSKLALKNELGRAIGLGNGDDPNSAAKAVYRYCSGETPVSIEKGLAVCHHIKNYELIQWIGFEGGMIMTPKAVINDLEALDDSDILGEIVSCLTESTSLVSLLSTAYHGKPSFELITKVEDVFLRAMLQMEKCRLMLRHVIERMLQPGSQGELWFRPADSKAGDRRRKKKRP
jgi:hypothetical protein